MLLKYLKWALNIGPFKSNDVMGTSRVNSFHFIQGQDSFISTKEPIVQEVADIRSSLFKLPYRDDFWAFLELRSKKRKCTFPTCQIFALRRFWRQWHSGCSGVSRRHILRGLGRFEKTLKFSFKNRVKEHTREHTSAISVLMLWSIIWGFLRTSDRVQTKYKESRTFPTVVFLTLSTATSPAVNTESTARMVALPTALEILPTAESAIPEPTKALLKGAFTATRAEMLTCAGRRCSLPNLWGNFLGGRTSNRSRWFRSCLKEASPCWRTHSTARFQPWWQQQPRQLSS